MKVTVYCAILYEAWLLRVLAPFGNLHVRRVWQAKPFEYLEGSLRDVVEKHRKHSLKVTS